MFTLNRSLFALLIAVGGCRSSVPFPARAQVTTRAERPAWPPDTFDTDTDYLQIVQPALARALREGKSVALYFNTQASSSCDDFRTDVLATPSVSAWIDEHLVFVNADLDLYPGLERKYLPHRSNRFLILTTEGDALAWIPKTASDPTPRTPDTFLAELRAALATR